MSLDGSLLSTQFNSRSPTRHSKWTAPILNDQIAMEQNPRVSPGVTRSDSLEGDKDRRCQTLKLLRLAQVRPGLPTGDTRLFPWPTSFPNLAMIRQYDQDTLSTPMPPNLFLLTDSISRQASRGWKERSVVGISHRELTLVITHRKTTSCMYSRLGRGNRKNIW